VLSTTSKTSLGHRSVALSSPLTLSLIYPPRPHARTRNHRDAKITFSVSRDLHVWLRTQ
jgi:hypothetical protein